MWWLRTTVSSICRQRRGGVAAESQQQQQQRTFSLLILSTTTPIITTTTKATTTTTLNKNNTRIGSVRLLGTNNNNNNGRNERKFSLVHALLAAPILIFMVLEARVQWLRRRIRLQNDQMQSLRKQILYTTFFVRRLTAIRRALKKYRNNDMNTEYQRQQLQSQEIYWYTIYKLVEKYCMDPRRHDPNTFPKAVRTVAISIYGMEEANWPDEVKAMTERPFNETDFFDHNELDYDELHDNANDDDDDDYHHQNREENNEPTEKYSSR